MTSAPKPAAPGVPATPDGSLLELWADPLEDAACAACHTDARRYVLEPWLSAPAAEPVSS